MSDRRTKSTEKNRTANKSRAKGKDLTSARNSDGMAVDTSYAWDSTGYYRLSLEETCFLDAYSETKADIKACMAMTGLTRKQINHMLTKDKVRHEIEEIQKVWRNQRRMKAENAASAHIELMDQLKRDYAEADLDQRAKFANPLTKASETYLKAAGHFNHGGGGSESQVVINIDLGGSLENEKKVEITGERKTD